MAALSLACFFLAQVPQIVRFIPARFLESEVHEVHLYNPYPRPLAIGGWLLVTREYSVRFPLSLAIPPKQRFRIGKRTGDLVLMGYPDFLIRFPQGSQPGAYAALLDNQGRFQGGVYLAPAPQVLFLPDSGFNITREGQRIPFYLPPESQPQWEYVPWEPDPIIGVVKIEGSWRYTVANPQKEALLHAPLRFSLPIASVGSQAIHIVWEVEGRARCENYVLERREERGPWRPLHRFPCPQPLPTRRRMEYYDAEVIPNRLYTYRLAYELEPGWRYESGTAEVVFDPKRVAFRMEAQPGSLRLWVATSQPVKIRLLDCGFAEQLRIYDGWLNGGVENVFLWDVQRVGESCWVVIWTPQRRYWQRL
ncbi:MAG: hypothetical protein NZ958_01035 [Bacteroidia bacterium]|nr:hypothetical protein [Bacteroidia bacterium]MDW8089247.1 hypothetical protein [Bacteroidia bacterium]